MDNLGDYMLISEAAAYLGVSPTTLRNWERRRKLTTYRHPINRYRLYRKSDLEAILGRIATSGGTGRQGTTSEREAGSDDS